MPQPSPLEPFITRLERLGIPYMVTGSTAGILYGEPRMTHDVDIVIALTVRDIQAVVEAFPIEDFDCPPEEVIEIEVRRGERGDRSFLESWIARLGLTAEWQRVVEGA